jgi:hypothetical protein
MPRRKAARPAGIHVLTALAAAAAVVVAHLAAAAVGARVVVALP